MSRLLTFPLVTLLSFAYKFAKVDWINPECILALGPPSFIWPHDSWQKTKSDQNFYYKDLFCRKVLLCAFRLSVFLSSLSLFLRQSHRISFSMSMFERRTFVQIKSIFISLNDSNLRLEVRRLGTKLTFIYHKHFDVNKHLNSTVYLPCGYGRRFVFQKSWVQIPAPDTR